MLADVSRSDDERMRDLDDVYVNIWNRVESRRGEAVLRVDGEGPRGGPGPGRKLWQARQFRPCDILTAAQDGQEGSGARGGCWYGRIREVVRVHDEGDSRLVWR